MITIRHSLLISFWFLTALVPVHADVTLASLFADHAVLQRGKPVPIWGRADAGEKITVSFRGQTVGATADPAGRWSVSLAPLAASAHGVDLFVSGKNSLRVHDVVVGEVWLCSGQSNMVLPVWQTLNGQSAIAAANFPLIRHVTINRAAVEVPANDAKNTGWQAATPEVAGQFTAVGYFFAREIHAALGVPVGLINSSWGGTAIKSWMSAATFAADPAFAHIGQGWEKIYAEEQTEFRAKLASWNTAEATAKAHGETAHAEFLKQTPRPAASRSSAPHHRPSALYNGMIHPLIPYALRGVLWYQGESNAGNARFYRALFPAMIAAWRADFGQGDIPFYWVNLASFKAGSDPTGLNWAFLREAQTQALALPHTGQAITIDIGDYLNIHPKNKQEVGRRLALIAKAQDYGLPGEYTGPVFVGATREGAALRVKFTHAQGLSFHDWDGVHSVQLAGADRVFHPATAKVERETLLATSPDVPEPVAIRYAWYNYPDANLYNGAGLPAVPFRSDDW